MFAARPGHSLSKRYAAREREGLDRITITDREERGLPTDSSTKKCPDCAEEVRAEARKCRFCGFIFEAAQSESGLEPLLDVYGRRVAQIARIHGIDTEVLETPENRRISAADVSARLAASRFTHVAVIHCETTTGIVNPIEEIGAAVAAAGAAFIVDAMSSFGAIPISLEAARADFLISSANKCIEGVPGFGFILARREALVAAQGRARTLSLDLHAQWAGLENDGQFRFTPPTHVLLAFHQALDELQAEGGVDGRAARYRRNYETLARGIAEMGFEAYLSPEDRGYIITTYRYPAGETFRFEEFYSRLSELGFIIYPGKLSQEPCFRIGTIGRLEVKDIEALLRAVAQVMATMTAAAAV